MFKRINDMDQEQFNTFMGEVVMPVSWVLLFTIFLMAAAALKIPL